MKKFALLVAAIVATTTLTMACKSQREEKNASSDIAPDSYEIPASLTDRPEQIIQVSHP